MPGIVTMKSVTLRLHFDHQRHRAQRDALDNVDAAVFEELRAEDAARHNGSWSLEATRCG